MEFVDGLKPEIEIRGHPKAHHKKSRSGCQRCKPRRVKCDEVHPVCGGCQRQKAQCVYDRLEGSKRPAGSESRNSTEVDDSESNACPGNIRKGVESSESRGRRLLELRLIHHYTAQTSRTLLLQGDPVATEVWINAVPDLAFRSDALLYSIYTISALHALEAIPENKEAIETYRRYLDMAIREHNNDLANLNESNFEAACVASSMLRVNAFAMLRDRPLNPYTPPVRWLEMTRGTCNVFEAAWEWIGGNGPLTAARLINRMPLNFDTETKFKETNRSDLLHLLHRSDADVVEEIWDAEIQKVYESTISYVGCIWISMKTGELPVEICRRLTTFAYLVPRRFLDLVKDQQPRALAVLAHYFALLARFRSVWWIGDPSREVHAISLFLYGGRCEELRRLPLQLLDEGTPYQF